jgi:hypothetical protein
MSHTAVALPSAGVVTPVRPGTAPEPSFDQSGRVPWHPNGVVPLPPVGHLADTAVNVF